VKAYPHRTALARRVRDGDAFVLLGRLEARGLVTRRKDLYALTRRGRDELELTGAVAHLVVSSRVKALHRRSRRSGEGSVAQTGREAR
jgi:DNA-binding PadR family transcriptional regulator